MGQEYKKEKDSGAKEVDEQEGGLKEGGCEKPKFNSGPKEYHKLPTSSPKRSKGEKYND